MKSFRAGAGSRAITRQVQRCLASWQTQSRHCGHATSELWQLHLPLVTMVGLTLIGLYDCKAVTLNAGAESPLPVPVFEQAAERVPAAADTHAHKIPAGSSGVKAFTIATDQDQPAPWTDLLHRRPGSTTVSAAPVGQPAQTPASRPFALALQSVLTGLTATAPPIA
ncbi:MAG TPA: hypothetical protein VL860_11210 [Planctomycetota bacterium]|nr:hypothetical protein [Planctomycetota bacterium]